MIVNIFIISISTISFIHICNMNDISNIHITVPHLHVVVDLIHVADLDESYGTYVDDGYVDHHDYDVDTDDDT